MARLVFTFVFTLSVLALFGASRADAGALTEASCCACEGDPGPALYCIRVSAGQETSAVQSCQAKGGSLLCLKTVSGRRCSFEGLDCPQRRAPAMGGAFLGALVALLGAAGIFGLRQQARRSRTARRA